MKEEEILKALEGLEKDREKKKDLTLEERVDMLEEQNIDLLVMLLQLAEGMAGVSDLLLTHIKHAQTKKEVMN